MHTVASDLIVLWVAVIVLIFAFLFFGAVSLRDKENSIVTVICQSNCAVCQD